MDSAILGALIGAISALLTALVAGGIGLSVARKQLQHAQTERRIDRALEIKKDRMLSMLDAVSRMRTALTQLTSHDLPVSDVQRAFNQAVNEVQGADAVSGLEVVRSVRSVVEACSTDFFRLLKLRISADLVKRDLDSKHEVLMAVGSGVEAFFAKQREVLHAPASDLEAIQRISTQVSEMEAKVQAASMDVASVASRWSAMVEDLARDCISSHQLAYGLVQELVQAVRIEIGVDPAGSRDYIAASH